MIPFNKPYVSGNEIAYINDAVSRGKLSGNGYYTQACQQYFESQFGFQKVLLTTSCTDALEMAAILLDIKEGDEVIMPTYTFVSTANAFALRGAKIVFADVCAAVPNIDVTKIESLITARTKAIVVTHYGGIATDMDAILSIAVEHKLFIVEDAAQCIGGKYKNLPLGSFGHLATFSFHETKNIQCGEGGMLVINDERFNDRAEIIWEKGTNRSAYFSGKVASYEWMDIGSSFLPAELNAAFLFAQTEAYLLIQNRRKILWQLYYEELIPFVSKHTFSLLEVSLLAQHNHHTFALVCATAEDAQKLILDLHGVGILAVTHYKCLHLSAYYFSQYNGMELNNARRFEQCLVRLPLFHELEQVELLAITAKIKSFYI